MAINKFKHISNTPLNLSGRIQNDVPPTSPTSSVVFSDSITISQNNATGGGIIFSDDGDIIDPNTGVLAFRFSSGIQVYSANRGGSPVISLESGGNIFLENSGTATRGLLGRSGDNDLWFFGGGATGSNAAFAQISTGDDASEPIYVRQYIGDPRSGTLIRTATLLDESGNTSFPGTVSGTFNGALNITGVSTVGFLTATGIWNAGITTSSRLTLNGANDTVTGGGQIYLNGATGNRIDFNTNGAAAPSFTTRSVGTKIVLFPSISGSQTDYAFGIDGGTLWYSIPSTTSHQHRWYAATTQLADLKSSGELVIGSTSLTGTASQRLQVTGGAYVSGSVGIGSTNPSSTLTVQGNTLITGVTTSSEFVGGGSDLRNLSGTHLVSYASASDVSNSALSISGISTYTQVGILTGSFAGDASDNFGYSVATSADGKTIVVGAWTDETGATTNTGVVYVYDRIGCGTSFNQVGILTGSLASQSSDNFGRSVATSADGKTIVVGASIDELTGTTGNGLVYVFDRVGVGTLTTFNQVGILTGTYAFDSGDSFGWSVATSADGKTIVVSAINDNVPGSTIQSGVVYVFDRVGNNFNQVGILTGTYSNGFNDIFGRSIAISADGRTIIAGSSDEVTGSGLTDNGIVYVFDRVGNNFNTVGILTGSLASTNDYFGSSVATSADGKTIVVGAIGDGYTTNTGLVYVFDRVGNTFNQVGILTGTYATSSNDWFGSSVATSADGKTIVVGAYNDEIGANTSSGVVYVYTRQGNKFDQVGILTGTYAVDANDFFGYDVKVSADGKSIIVGAYADEIGATTGTGVVYVFDEVRNTYLHSSPIGNIGIGVTNPSSKLHVVGDALITRVAITTTATNITMEPGRTYPYYSSITLTLPASPTAGDKVEIINRSNTATAVVARNGRNIMGLAEDMTIDVPDVGFTLIYANLADGWIIGK